MTSSEPTERARCVTLLCVGYERRDRDRIAASFEGIDSYEPQTFAVDSVESAVAFLEERPVDCIVSEYHLDDAPGTALAREVDVPVVLFVEDGSEAIASEAISAGVDEYVRRSGDRGAYRELVDVVSETVVSARRDDHEAAMLADVPVNSLPIMLYTIDAQGVVTHSRGRGLANIGLEPDEVVGESVYELYGDLPEAIHGVETALEGDLVTTSVDVGGRAIETTFAPITDGTSVDGVVGLSLDVTEQVAAEREARRLYAAIESTVDGIAILDEAGEYVYVNEAHADIYGFDDPEAMIGRGWQMLYDDEELERFRTQILPELEREGEWRGEAIGTRTDGTQFSQDLTLTTLASGGLVCGVRDITGIKERERALKSLNDTAPRLMNASTHAEITRLAVETARDVLDRPITGAWLYDDESETLRPFTTADGVDEVDDQPAFHPGQSSVWGAFETGNSTVVSDVISTSDGETPVRSELVLPLGEHGVLICGSVRDRRFTEYDREFGTILAAATAGALTRADREMALKRRERELERKNARLEEFANVVAHDVRNPLTVAKGYLEIEREREGAASRHLDGIEHGLERVTEIVENLLVLARAGERIGTTERVEIDRIARQAWSTVGASEARILFDGTRVVEGDRLRLTQLFENLFRNAIEHGGTDVTVRVGVLDGDAGFYVEDDGPGIPRDRRERLFTEQPTEDRDGARRFGLAIVTDIVEAHDWRLSVTESASGGARFEVLTASDNTAGAYPYHTQ
ncbi:sensor histidine kinase [Natrononativus amylolyticus]|uniref:sensor histidine kinase n=1 Tax=Natrononativus amylolyticus TaxID=2963434 RepID=UPI0020CE0814|nr:PAS domain S-box protein [Natrononativus amylolyticus]